MPTVSALWESIRARKARVPQFVRVSDDRTIALAGQVRPILPQQHYFAIVVDELFLLNDRQWFREFDPVVLAVTEFVHGGRTIGLPFVVGPKLMGNSGTPVPQGMLYRQTRVAGVHPFRGGRIVSTVVLCQVKRADYTRRWLSFVESVATAVPFAAELGTYIKYADSLLDGIDSLLGVEATTPLVGVRQEFDHDVGQPIEPAYFALIDAPEAPGAGAGKLWVRHGNLLVGETLETAEPFREASYVLFSTRGVASISDFNTLPFHEAVETILNLAATANESDWKRAKAELVVLLRSLISSPDLTRPQALAYHDEVVEQTKEVRMKARRIGTLDAASRTSEFDELRSAVRLLDLP